MKPLKTLFIPSSIEAIIEEQYHYRLDQGMSVEKAEEFKAEIRAGFDQIKRTPRSWPKKEEFRKYRTPVFNHLIYYDFDEVKNAAVVTALVHYAQDPFGPASEDEG